MKPRFPQAKHPEIRFTLDAMPLTTLAGAQGFTEGCTPTDLVRSSVFACCYLQILLNPAWRPLPAFRDECRAYAEFLFKDFLPVIEAGCTTRVRNMVPMIDLHDPKLYDFERSFLHRVQGWEKGTTHVHADISKALWHRVKKDYGFVYGATNANFQTMLAGLVYQLTSIVNASGHSDDAPPESRRARES
jgi:hypothetical protein